LNSFTHSQDEIHDSIEDAKTALLLYRHYEEVAAKGPEFLAATLQDLYNYGMRTNWTIGMEKLRDSGVSVGAFVPGSSSNVKSSGSGVAKSRAAGTR
jgi:hypothetical protein